MLVPIVAKPVRRAQLALVGLPAIQRRETCGRDSRRFDRFLILAEILSAGEPWRAITFDASILARIIRH